MDISATISMFSSQKWLDYQLLDSGDGLKLERFGSYVLVRPEVQAMWNRALPQSEWDRAAAHFRPSGEESGGHWDFKRKVADKWELSYPLDLAPVGASLFDGQLRFWVMTTPGRHLGLFPEAAAQWDFVVQAVKNAGQPPRILNLFGYTGLASLAAAAAGAQVTHVDASKKSVHWARQNQALSKLDDKPVRWIVDDALKFVFRELRRGAHYDGILIDPPKFGRGPSGEVWEVFKSLPKLMHACRQLLSAEPLFLVLTVYAVKASAVHLGQLLSEVASDFGGRIEIGELANRERNAAAEGRLLSQAVFARWQRE